MHADLCTYTNTSTVIRHNVMMVALITMEAIVKSVLIMIVYDDSVRCS